MRKMEKERILAVLTLGLALLCCGCGQETEDPAGEDPAGAETQVEIVAPAAPGTSAGPTEAADPVPPADPSVPDAPGPAAPSDRPTDPAERPDDPPPPSDDGTPAPPETPPASLMGEDPQDVQARDLPGASASLTADGAYLDAVRAYIVDEYGDWVDGETILCSPVVHKVDRTDPQDVKVYGNFWIFAYDRDGKTMLTTGAADIAGDCHLAPAKGGYAVTSFGMLGDGAFYEQDARRISGGDEGLLDAFLSSHDAVRDDLRARDLRDWAARTGTDIDSYRDTDGTVVPLG